VVVTDRSDDEITSANGKLSGDVRGDERIARLGEVAVLSAANEAAVAGRIVPTVGRAIRFYRNRRAGRGWFTSRSLSAALSPAATAIVMPLESGAAAFTRVLILLGRRRT
jgi:hypothetical protein